MPGKVTLDTIGNWSKEVGVPLSAALSVSTDITGQTGERACRQALIFMAMSARKITRQARKNRRVRKEKGRKYVEVWKKSGIIKVFEWAFSKTNDSRIQGTWEQAKRIGARGLAKRSWMWGLAPLGKRPKSRPISGTFSLRTIRETTAAGYILNNQLDYIKRALPGGWEQSVARAASNRIMGNARRKLERKWQRAMGTINKNSKPTNRVLADFFREKAA